MSQAVGGVGPKELMDARLWAHAAAQVPAAAARAIATPAANDTHTALTWNPAARRLDGAELGSDPNSGRRLRFAVDLERGRVHAISEGQGELAFEPQGRTLPDMLRWAEGVIADKLDHQVSLVVPDYDLPADSRFSTGRFDEPPIAAFTELARWFGLAGGVLTEAMRNNVGALAVLCWPHHFDIATRIDFDPPAKGEDGRSIGVGFSPGDGGIEEPYFYVTPWPPPTETLPPLPVGAWNVEGWTGALLRGSQLIAAATPNGDARAIASRFVDAAVRESRVILRL